MYAFRWRRAELLFWKYPHEIDAILPYSFCSQGKWLFLKSPESARLVTATGVLCQYFFMDYEEALKI